MKKLSLFVFLLTLSTAPAEQQRLPESWVAGAKAIWLVVNDRHFESVGEWKTDFDNGDLLEIKKAFSGELIPRVYFVGQLDSKGIYEFGQQKVVYMLSSEGAPAQCLELWILDSGIGKRKLTGLRLIDFQADPNRVLMIPQDLLNEVRQNSFNLRQ